MNTIVVSFACRMSLLWLLQAFISEGSHDTQASALRPDLQQEGVFRWWRNMTETEAELSPLHTTRSDCLRQTCEFQDSGFIETITFPDWFQEQENPCTNAFLMKNNSASSMR